MHPYKQLIKFNGYVKNNALKHLNKAEVNLKMSLEKHKTAVILLFSTWVQYNAVQNCSRGFFTQIGWCSKSFPQILCL